MNILLTNDDGYQANGINFLKEYFEKKDHKVFIVVPDREKSGSSHSITLKDTIKLIDHKDNLWILNGTPADCVILGLLGLIKEKIDFVVSGINHGPNIGRDIIYSGTAAAAREAGFSKIPSMALSIDCWEKYLDFEVAEYFLNKYFNKLSKSIKKNFFYNINFPNIKLEELNGVQMTVPCPNHYYMDELLHFEVPFQGKYYWVNGYVPNYKLQKGTDAMAIKNNYISVSPVKIFPEAEKINFKL